MAYKKRSGPEDALDKAVGGVGEAVGRVGSAESLEAEGRVLRRKGELKTCLVKRGEGSLQSQCGGDRVVTVELGRPT